MVGFLAADCKPQLFRYALDQDDWPFSVAATALRRSIHSYIVDSDLSLRGDEVRPFFSLFLGNREVGVGSVWSF